MKDDQKDDQKNIQHRRYFPILYFFQNLVIFTTISEYRSYVILIEVDHEEEWDELDESLEDLEERPETFASSQ